MTEEICRHMQNNIKIIFLYILMFMFIDRRRKNKILNWILASIPWI
jgi:hypothetical protein